MPEDGVISIAVVCEADADRRTACELADRILCHNVEWIEPEVLDSYRRWRGFGGGEMYLKVSRVWSVAKEHNIKAHGHFGDKPGAPDARVARTAFLLLRESDPQPHAILFIVDTDNDPTRIEGCKQAREFAWQGQPWPFEIILGLPHPKRECWVLSGYVPSDETEKARLDRTRPDLGFDPCVDSHLLIAKHIADKKSAKRVLASLIEGDASREQSCWQNCDLQTLMGRGAQNGLADFLAEVKDHLVPLFKPVGKQP
jgi:hypothetical protein